MKTHMRPSGSSTTLLGAAGRALVDPWLGEHVRVEVAAPASVATARVVAALSDPALRGWGPHRVRGSARFGRIGVWVDDGYGNSFRPVLVATVEPLTEQSCMVVGRIRMFLFSIVFMGAWIACAVISAAIVCVAALIARDAMGLLSVALSVAFPAFGIGMVTFGWRWARAQRTGLRDWLVGPCGVMNGSRG